MSKMLKAYKILLEYIPPSKPPFEYMTLFFGKITFTREHLEWWKLFDLLLPTNKHFSFYFNKSFYFVNF